MITGLLESAVSLVFPPQCECCALPLEAPSAGICPPCEDQIRFILPPHCASCGRTLPETGSRCSGCSNASFEFDRAYACAVYDGKMKDLLHAYKFGNRRYLKKYLSGRMADFFTRHIGISAVDAVAAIPMHPDKKRERGFNQSALLTRRLSHSLGLQDLSDELRRTRSSSPQALLSKSSRKSNVERSFSADETVFSGKKILLIDDILTTGNTASECARALKAAGARSVTVLACARGA